MKFCHASPVYITDRNIKKCSFPKVKSGKLPNIKSEKSLWNPEELKYVNSILKNPNIKSFKKMVLLDNFYRI